MFLFEKHGGDTLKPGQNEHLFVWVKKSAARHIKYAGLCNCAGQNMDEVVNYHADIMIIFTTCPDIHQVCHR